MDVIRHQLKNYLLKIYIYINFRERKKEIEKIHRLKMLEYILNT